MDLELSFEYLDLLRYRHYSKAKEAECSSLQHQISELKTLVREMVVGDMHQAKEFSYPPSMEYDCYYGTMPQNFQQLQPNSFDPPPRKQSTSLEEIVESIATNTLQFQQDVIQFQQETRADLRDLKNQVNQLASSLSLLESQWEEKVMFQEQIDKLQEPSLEQPEVLVTSSLGFDEEDEEKEILKHFQEDEPLMENQECHNSTLENEVMEEKIKETTMVTLTEECDFVFGDRFLPKLEDSGSFFLPCTNYRIVFIKALNTLNCGGLIHFFVCRRRRFGRLKMINFYTFVAFIFFGMRKQLRSTLNMKEVLSWTHGVQYYNV